MSGRFADGGVGPTFYFSVGQPLGRRKLKLVLTPLSQHHPERLKQPPITIRWRSSNGQRGQFCLIENGQTQKFPIELRPSDTHPFIHFSCKADFSGQLMEAGRGLPARAIIAFLDAVEAQD